MTAFDDSIRGMLQNLFAGSSALVLEDEPEFGDPIRSALLDAGFASVALVTRGEDALEAAQRQAFDVILLDRLNPGMDGIEVLRRIRNEDRHGPSAQAPALIVSSLGADSSRVEGVMAGANDYIPKPVDEKEVVLRVAAQLAARRKVVNGADEESEWIEYGAFRLNRPAHIIEFDGKEIDLGRGLPFKIMSELIAAKGIPLSHGMLWDRCWTHINHLPDEFVNVVDTRMAALRKMLKAEMVSREMPDSYQKETDSIIVKVWLEGFIVRMIEKPF